MGWLEGLCACWGVVTSGRPRGCGSFPSSCLPLCSSPAPGPQWAAGALLLAHGQGEWAVQALTHLFPALPASSRAQPMLPAITTSYQNSNLTNSPTRSASRKLPHASKASALPQGPGLSQGLTTVHQTGPGGPFTARALRLHRLLPPTQQGLSSYT